MAQPRHRCMRVEIKLQCYQKYEIWYHSLSDSPSDSTQNSFRPHYAQVSKFGYDVTERKKRMSSIVQP